MDANTEATANSAMRDVLTVGLYSLGIGAGAVMGLAAVLLAA